jgi:hypothetical protein
LPDVGFGLRFQLISQTCGINPPTQIVGNIKKRNHPSTDQRKYKEKFMTTEKTWKYWTLRSLIAVLLISLFWVGNLIWFKPFSIRHFYDRAFVELAFNDPELTTSMGIPVLYDMSKDELTDVSDQRQWDNFNRIKENYKTLMSYNFKSQSTANQLNTKILGWFRS